MAKSEARTLSLGRFAPDAKGWIQAAQALADERGHSEIQPLHLLSRGVAGHSGVAEVFRRAGTDVLELSAACERALDALPRGTEPSYLSQRMLDLLGRAERDADRDRAPEVLAEHLLNALSQEVRGPAGEILGGFGVGPGSLKAHLSAMRSAAVSTSFGSVSDVAAPETRDLVKLVRDGKSDPVVGRDAELRRLITILERREKCHPLLVGEPGVGKRAIVRALAERLASGDLPTSLAGARLLEVDMAALVAGARLRADVEARVKKLIDVTQAGSGEAILFVRGMDQLFGQTAGSGAGDALRSAMARDAVRLLGSTNPEGMRKLSERDPALLRRLTVLEVEEPTPAQAIEILRGVSGTFERHHGVRVGESAIVASVTLAKRYLQDRFLPDSAIDLLDESAAALRVETDGVPAEFDGVMRRLDAVRAQLGSLEGADDSATQATRARLAEEASGLEPKVAEMKKKLESRRGAVAAVRALSSELETQRRALGDARSKKDYAKAGELEQVTIPALEQRHAAAEQAARTIGASVESVVLGEEHIALTLAAWTGIPVAKMLEAEAERLLKMEERLEQRVVGQSEGVRALSRAVRRGRVGLRDPRRPIGSFLFLGPSGVGKTELAKALAEFLFDDEAALTRLDMSEFMERHMAQRLLGAPPGYADSEQGGFLTEAVRRRPYSVLLFDEVEKAHQDVWNLLLQVLDDGRLTDGRGRLADFTNTVVILTSNIGSQRILETDARLFETEDGREALRDVLIDELGRIFRPEFLNRIDDVIVFRPLARADLARIVDIQLDRVRALLAPRRVKLEVDEPAKARLVELGYQPALGARPVRRAIVQHIQDPLAEKLLEKGAMEGATVRVRLSGQVFEFDVTAAES
jgi:ATP-dependent Clp protease ATP-binding subunit ClpB